MLEQVRQYLRLTSWPIITAMITLIVIGTTLKLIRDIALRVGDIPREQLIKAQTLGASTAQIASRIVLPQILPRLIDAVRLEIGPAWLFLIAAEAIAATRRAGELGRGD